MNQIEEDHKLNEKKFKNAKRWFIIFLTMGIVGTLDFITNGAIYVYVNSRLGGVAALVFHVLSQLDLLWYIIAFLSRRQMNKLSRNQRKAISS